MEIKASSILNSLTAKTIKQLNHLAVLDKQSLEDDSEVLLNTIVFITLDDDYFELIVNQESVNLKKIDTEEDYIINFTLESDENISLVPVAKTLDYPFTIASIIEIWAGESYMNLVAVIFLDKDKNPIFSILTETDEINFITTKELQPIINQMIFDYGLVTYKWNKS